MVKKGHFNGVNMTGNESIKQPDITKTFPCTCPCFIKTGLSNNSLTLSSASKTSLRGSRDFEEFLYNAKDMITARLLIVLETTTKLKSW